MAINSELVAQAAKGDREAYGQLYNQIYPSLYRAALYTLGSQEDAQDVVAETFLDGYLGIKKLRSAGAFSGWLFRILSTKCKTTIRYYVNNRTYQLGTDEKNQSQLMVSDQPVENRVDLAIAMAKLAPEERLIVVLFVVEGYTTKEIAKIMKMPGGTVSSKIHRALVKLKKELEGEISHEQEPGN